MVSYGMRRSSIRRSHTHTHTRMHLSLSLDLHVAPASRKTGWHSFQITDGEDSSKVWSKDFRVLGWFDDFKAAVPPAREA